MQLADTSNVLADPRKLLIDAAQGAKQRLLISIDAGYREEFPTQIELLKRYQALIAASDYLAGFDKKPRFGFSAPVLATLLKRAEIEHKKAVEAGTATDADWPNWYADYIINGEVKE